MFNNLRSIVHATPLSSRLSDGSCGVRRFARKQKPLASEVLTSYLSQCKEPPWTSYFVRYIDVVNDQRGMSHFNWSVGVSNYHVLRTGCFPYIKYHCTKRPKEDLSFDDKFYKAIKIINLGIPTLMYGLAAIHLIRHEESVTTSHGKAKPLRETELNDCIYGRVLKLFGIPARGPEWQILEASDNGADDENDSEISMPGNEKEQVRSVVDEATMLCTKVCPANAFSYAFD